MHYKANKIVDNLDKPIMAFAGMVAGKAGMKMLDKFLSNVNLSTPVLEFSKAAITTGLSMYGFYRSSQQRSDNAEYFFIGSATSGVAKAVEVISGGQLNGWLDGLGYTTTTADPVSAVYGEADHLPYEGGYLQLPELDQDVVMTTTEPVSGGIDYTETTDDPVEDVEYEEVYEID